MAEILMDCPNCEGSKYCVSKPNKNDYKFPEEENQYLMDLECGIWNCHTAVIKLLKENAELKMKLLNFENKKEWVDFSKFDFCDDIFKHFLFKLENGNVYCGYMTEDVADGDCCFGLTYFKDNLLKSESDWGFITSINGSKITHFMRIENLGE